MVNISIHLFGKPSWELELEKELDETFIDELAELRESLYDRLSSIGNDIEILMNAGWSAYGTLYDVVMQKDIGVDKAREELKELELEHLFEYVEKYEDEE